MTTTTTAIRRPFVSAAASVWRFIRRCLHWLRRAWWKIGLWIITLTTLAWQYENWHGRRALAEQRAQWKAEYGNMKQSDLAPPRIPDDENFFAAPVFETFVVKEPRAYLLSKDDAEKAGQEFLRKADEAADQLPHGRFLRTRWPQIATSPWEAPDTEAAEGCLVLDLATWAKNAAAAGQTRPAGLTDSQWLYSTFPPDDTLKGLIAALTRRKACLLPHPAERWKVGEQLGAPWASPLPAISNMFGSCRHLAFRARAAARAGERLPARQLNEIFWLLTEGFGNGATLVETLVALATGNLAESATLEGLASRCWNDTDLAVLSERLAALDEDKSVFSGLYQEAFGLHLWSGGALPLFRSSYLALYNNAGWAKRLYTWILIHGPQGWEDANFAHHLRWWRMLLIPDSPGDDLVVLNQRLETGLEKIREETKAFSPWSLSSMRKVWTIIAMPAMSNLAGHALKVQTRRRQLLLAIAIERHALARGTLPQKPGDIVPAFLSSIPNDPWQPGTPLRWETGITGTRYRILSAGENTTLAMPESLPK